MMLSDSNRLRHWRNLAHVLTRVAFTRESERSFDLGVLWAILCVRQVEGAAGRVQTEIALPRTLQSARNLMSVAHIKCRRVNQRAIPFLGNHLKSPECRLSERIFHRTPLIRVVCGRAEGVIRSD